MTLEEAAVLASKFAPEGSTVDADRARETREGWYCAFRWQGGPRFGSKGVIVNKRTGAVLVLGSAYPVERDLAAYDEGFQFSYYDLTITSVRDERLALDALEQLDIDVVVPEFEHGVTWRIPRELTRKELQERISRLPCTFLDVHLYNRVEVLQEVRRDGRFTFELREHVKPA